MAAIVVAVRIHRGQAALKARYPIPSSIVFQRFPLSRLCLLAWLAVITLLAGCGGGGGGGSSSTAPVIVSISVSPTSIGLGETTTLTWSTTNASSCQASGNWSGSRATSGSLQVSPSAVGSFTYSLLCTGPGGTSTGSTILSVTAVNNTVPIVLDGGPTGVNGVVGIINIPFVSVTLCRPGTTVCQTIDHVLLDTGSYGLRILNTVLDPTLALPTVNAPSGNAAGECAQFYSGYLWGSVHRADIKMAGEVASSLPIQVVADTSSSFASIPTSCSNTGANLGTVQSLGANGILGVGLFKQDCGSACTTTAIAGTYYACTATGCASSTMPLASQVSNPVAAFAVDNAGVVVSLPGVPVGGASSLSGLLTFGVDTQANNQVGSATVYSANASGYFTTVYKGTTMSSSFIDSGSNGLFFADASLPLCTSSTGFIGFYCPASSYTVNAVNTAANGTASGSVSVVINSPSALDPSVRAAPVAGSLSSRRTRPITFDWGLPFFFGRSIYVAIDGASTQHGIGPYWAY